jgi:hypothetical protein
MADIFYSPFLTIENDSNQAIVQNDTKTLYITMQNVNLTNRGVQFTMTSLNPSYPYVPNGTSWPVVVNRACTVLDPVNGVSFITLIPQETAVTGTYVCQVSLTDNNGNPLQTVYMFNMTILKSS